MVSDPGPGLVLAGRKAAARLRAGLAQALHRWRGWRGNLDGLSNDMVTGWAAPADPAAGMLRVGLFTVRGRVASTTAGLFRADLLAAGIGDGRHGFELRLDAAARQAIHLAGGAFTVRILGGLCHPARKTGRPGTNPTWPIAGDEAPGPELGRGTLGAPDAAQPHPVAAGADSELAATLYGSLVRLGMLSSLPAPRFPAAPAWRRHFFARPPAQDGSDPGVPGGADHPPEPPAYADHLRLRSGMDIGFSGRDGGRKFLFWYLDSQARRNGGQRLPLSAAQIAWGNEALPPDLSAEGDAAAGHSRAAPQPMQTRSDRTNPAGAHPGRAYPGPDQTGRAYPAGDIRCPLVPAAGPARGTDSGDVRPTTSEYETGACAAVPPITRAQEVFLPLCPALASTRDPGSDEWRSRVILWWLLEAAPSLRVEDCLVPSRQQAWLAGAGHKALTDALLQGLPGLAPADLVPALLALSPERPGLLACLPRGAVAAALTPDASGQTAFSRFLARMRAAGAPELPLFACAAEAFPALERALQRCGFDLRRGTFLGLTPEGDRLEPMMLPLPEGPLAEVQVIGPLAKASGLGQAARLSVAALELTGRRLNALPYGADNPTPEDPSRGQNPLSGQPGPLAAPAAEGSGAARALAPGPSPHPATEPRARPGAGDATPPQPQLAPARVNLLHLNAEALPQAFAHLPDVFSGAWNIGYVFWELDRPALCHDLGLRLVDELWVASEFGAGIYRPEAPGPVTNVGMCFEDSPAMAAVPGCIPELAARAQVNQILGPGYIRIGPDEFLFLVAFDSYSFLQRKNPLGAIEAFSRAFPAMAGEGAKVRLLLKTHNRANAGDKNQTAIWAELDRRVAADPRLVLLDGTLDYDGQLDLMRAADAYVSLHRSEGWGFGMIEAMNLGVPVICTGWSGNMEFCSDKTAFLVGWTGVPVRPGEYIFRRPGHSWAEPDLDDAARQMRRVQQDPALRQTQAARARQHVRKNFSAHAIAARYAARLEAILADRPRLPSPAPGDPHG